MVESLKSLDHGIGKGPSFASIQENRLDDSLIEHAHGSGGCSVSHENPGNHGPALLCLLEVVVECGPVAVVVREETTQVAKGIHLLQDVLVELESNGAGFKGGSFCSSVGTASHALATKICIVVPIVELSVGDLKPTALALWVDRGVLFEDMDQVIPVAMVEVGA